MKTKKVVATDISKNAVKNTMLNAKKHKVHIDARCGSLFNPVSKGEKFDVIFFNAPFGFRKKPVKGILEKSVWDYKYFTLKNFLKAAKNHLSENGKILLGFSSIGHISFLKQEARKCKYSVEDIKSKKGRQGKVTGGFQIYKLYELRKR